MTVPAANHEAVFEGELEKPGRASITISDSKCLITVYLEPGVIDLQANLFTTDEGRKCISKKKVTGSTLETVIKQFEDDSEKIRKKFEPEFASEKIKVLAMHIIRKYPDQYISVELVTRLHKELGTEWALSAIELIDEDIKVHAVSYVNKASMSSEFLKIGNALDFTLPALEDSFTLSSLRGKYVLLDF
ncbi:MAG: hypothetical protein ACXWV3_10260, partial [Flavisolibacter sp.]